MTPVTLQSSAASNGGSNTAAAPGPLQRPHPDTWRSLALIDRSRVGRRAAIAILTAAPLAAASARAADDVVPPPPIEVGEVQGTLNDCTINAVSCASSMSDDVRFFYNPWEYEGPREAAVEQLIQVATGGVYDPGLRLDGVNGSVGIARSDAAAFILGTTLNTIAGRPPPEKPRPRIRAEFRAFDGVLMDRHTTEDGSEYVWVTFGLPGDDSSSSSSSDDEEEKGTGDSSSPAAKQAVSQQQQQQQQQLGEESAAQEESDSDGEGSSSSSSDEDEAATTTAKAKGSNSSSKTGGQVQQSNSSKDRSNAASSRRGGKALDPSTIIDAEFLFPTGDSIVNVRAASRVEPGIGGGQLALSFEQGVVFDRNEARRRMESLRKALRWESIAVVSNDDPRYNGDRPLFFERLYQPFMQPGRPATQE